MSLASTGYAYYTSDGSLTTGRITTDKLRGSHRLVYVRNQIAKLLDAARPELVAYEDYAMSSRAHNMFHIGELGGVLKALIWEKGIDLLPIPPALMKSVIALNGRAEKADITKALRNRFALLVAQHDEADATGLMIVGEIRSGTRKFAGDEGKSDRTKKLFETPISKGKLQSISFSGS